MHSLQLLCLFTITLLAASSARAACPGVSALPATFPEGIKVRPYTLTNLGGSPAEQEFCVFLHNVSGAAVPFVSVDHQMEEPGGGVPGPWALVSTTKINISGGVSTTCSSTGLVGTTSITGGTLAAGAASDICCFVLQADPLGVGCSQLPDAGDVARHTFASGSVVETELGMYSNTGGTTCGLVGLELLVVLPLLRLVRFARREVAS